MLAGFPLSAWLISSFVGIGSASATPPAVAKAAKIEMLPLENIVSLFVGVALRDLHHDLPHRGLVPPGRRVPCGKRRPEALREPRSPWCEACPRRRALRCDRGCSPASPSGTR